MCLAVKGAWSCWSSWSQCSVVCGGGHYQRTRTCTSPAPANGGDICIGLHTEEALCNTHTCDGEWAYAPFQRSVTPTTACVAFYHTSRQAIISLAVWIMCHPPSHPPFAVPLLSSPPNVSDGSWKHENRITLGKQHVAASFSRCALDAVSNLPARIWIRMHTPLVVK